MILWVDDDSITLRAYIDELEEAGYKVVMAKDPDEMWSKLSLYDSLVNAIIMDILMPTGNQIDSQEAEMGYSTGLILLNQLQDNELYKNIPVVIVTILTAQKVVEWARVHGVPFLNKHMTSPEELLEKLNELKIIKDR